MTIKVGDKIPYGVFSYVPYESGEDLKACPFPQPYKIHDKLKNKRAVIFGIPAAFSPTCSEQHVPSFVENADALKAKGIEEIICTAVNDGFATNTFGKLIGAKDKIIMAGDGNGEFAKSIGMEQDMTALGMGVRSKRYAMVVDDLVVKYLGVEEGGEVTSSSAEAVLENL
ncbi:hypothetical protein VTP01DRAFT_810 [Rhizomucor pusillus]|uniref:uncharacterized protein n=1 Tax=Rhizomucor pusillus TaxID=4840 RepID=UPI0037440030